MGQFTTIRKEGGSRIIAVTKYIPREWEAVEISTVSENESEVTIKIEKVK